MTREADDAIAALCAWQQACPVALRSQVNHLLATAMQLRTDGLVATVNARAAMHGHCATKTAWTDVADPARVAGAIFSTVGSCDTHLLSKPSGAFIEMAPTVDSAKIAAQVPLHEVCLYGQQSVTDYLLDHLHVSSVPRTATVKAKACLVYSDTAEVMLRVRGYHGVGMTTYAFVPSGTWPTVGVRNGSGLLGMGDPSGAMKAFAFAPAAAAEVPSGSAKVEAFGPHGAGLTTGRTDVIMTMTLFHGAPSKVPTACVYRSLGAASVTASCTDIGAKVERPVVTDDDVTGVVIELLFCKVVTSCEASDTDTDDMCHQLLTTQSGLGSTAPAVLSALDAMHTADSGNAAPM